MFDQRFFKITLAVLLFHAGLLYLIQSGLGRKLTEAVVAPEIVARIIPLEPPKQEAPPEPPKPKPKQETPPKQVKVTTPKPAPQPKPTPQPVANLPPTPSAPEAPAAPPAPPAPPEPAPAPVSAAPRAVGIGEIQCTPPQPKYPSQSRRMGETGRTVVRLTTDEGGKVVKTSVVSSSGSSRLDQAAVEAVQAMRCKPYTDNGRAIAVTAQQPIGFELN
ncbi:MULTISPECIES: energy transducer TonB [unclassified Cupriavidus]|uniref:energy transducer TonB n=1 Tax=unclassified Cupriavidus TaxID=2640874 RepID=UPI001056383C|nr:MULTISPECIES: energy transducer TonB [unclassified Cupriavidus]MBF6992350.1 TonB family protein [Cupriavidus sp. IK-TO18]TDF64492.1 energy transducer TonB [Cupriavidus sp. L7L]